MLQVIAPQKFKTIPWKNGLGETTELAINEGGNLDSFDWRLSIASVINDGVFSDFSGYQRNLVLIAGNGIMLKHDDNKVDNLTNLLDIAKFDGDCKTHGKLCDGAIKDFNIITNNQKIQPQVNCYLDAQEVRGQLTKLNIYFAYSLTREISIKVSEQEKVIVPQGHLVKMSLAGGIEDDVESMFQIDGENLILIQLKLKEFRTI